MEKQASPMIVIEKPKSGSYVLSEGLRKFISLLVEDIVKEDINILMTDLNRESCTETQI